MTETFSLLLQNSSGLHLDLILANEFWVIIIIHDLSIESDLLHLLIMSCISWYSKQVFF
jgi:hypothetical protein